MLDESMSFLLALPFGGIVEVARLVEPGCGVGCEAAAVAGQRVCVIADLHKQPALGIAAGVQWGRRLLLLAGESLNRAFYRFDRFPLADFPGVHLVDRLGGVYRGGRRSSRVWLFRNIIARLLPSNWWFCYYGGFSRFTFITHHLRLCLCLCLIA